MFFIELKKYKYWCTIVIITIVSVCFVVASTKWHVKYGDLNIDISAKHIVESGDDCVGTIHILSSNSAFIEFGCIAPFMKKYSYDIKHIVYCDGLHGKAGFLIVLNTNVNLYYDNSLERKE